MLRLLSGTEVDVRSKARTAGKGSLYASSHLGHELMTGKYTLSCSKIEDAVLPPLSNKIFDFDNTAGIIVQDGGKFVRNLAQKLHGLYCKSLLNEIDFKLNLYLCLNAIITATEM